MRRPTVAVPRIDDFLDVGQPHAHRGSKNSSAHREREDKKSSRDCGAYLRATAIPRAQVNFKQDKRQEELRESEKSEERSLKCFRIKPNGTLVDDEPQHQPNPEKPHTTNNHEQAQRPAAMNIDFAGNCKAQRHGGAEHDEDGIYADRNVLRSTTNGATRPDHVETGKADDEGSQQVYAPIPVVKRRRTGADLRHKLKRSCDQDNERQKKMCRNGDIADRVAGNEARLSTARGALNCHASSISAGLAILISPEKPLGTASMNWKSLALARRLGHFHPLRRAQPYS